MRSVFSFNRNIILRLSLIDDIGPAAISALIKRAPKDFVFADAPVLTVSDWSHIFGLSRKQAVAICDGLQDDRLYDRECALIEKESIEWATVADETYPLLLRHIHLPPAIIYWRGNLTSSHKSIAFVGARKANGYGKAVIERLVPPLVKDDWVIVSGGARGADSMAHQATLNAGGATVAVLGSGLLQTYPYENKKLFDQIVEGGGALVSSFPLLAPALAGNFPARNRIIAGLSSGCVVVQAAKKSGALITARYALDQGRSVFAVPGLIGDDLSAGCHALIQDGAQLVTSIDDIVNELGMPISCASQKMQRDEINMTITSASQSNNAVVDPLLTLCKVPHAVEDIARTLNQSIDAVQERLFSLQLDGAIEQDFAGLWQAR